jgi:hypothetical protein
MMNEVIVKDIEAKMELMNNCLKLGQTMMKSYQHQKLRPAYIRNLWQICKVTQNWQSPRASWSKHGVLTEPTYGFEFHRDSLYDDVGVTNPETKELGEGVLYVDFQTTECNGRHMIICTKEHLDGYSGVEILRAINQEISDSKTMSHLSGRLESMDDSSVAFIIFDGYDQEDSASFANCVVYTEDEKTWQTPETAVEEALSRLMETVTLSDLFFN